MRASQGRVARRLSRVGVLVALAFGAVGIVLSPVAAYASVSPGIAAPTAAELLAAKTYNAQVQPGFEYNISGVPSCTRSSAFPVYVSSFVIGGGAGVNAGAGAFDAPCLYSNGSSFEIDFDLFLADPAGSVSGRPVFTDFQVTTVGPGAIATEWQNDVCYFPPGANAPVCPSSPAIPAGSVGSGPVQPGSEFNCPNPSVSVSASPFFCIEDSFSGSGALSSVPSGYVVDCYASSTDSYYKGSWYYTGYSCAVYGVGSDASPLNLTCSVAANASNGMVNFNYSDGAKYGWTAAITASASGASPASGTGGDTGAFTTVLPVSTTESQIQVVWSSGSTFEGTCERAVDFYPSGSGGGSSLAGSGVGSNAPAGSFNFSACAPSGFGWLNPVSLLKGFGCLLQGLFVPTTNDLNSLYSVIQVSPFMSALMSAPTRVTAAATGWSPSFAFGSFSVVGRSVSIGSMSLPSISAGGYINVVIECIVGVVDLVLLISVFT